METQVPSNLQDVPVLDDYVKTMLVLQTVITTDSQMGKFQQKILQVMGPLIRLCMGLEDVRNESSEAVEVPVDTFASLIEQTTLLLGQASLSISYARRLNTLKALPKDPCKAKTLLKEKTALFQEEEGHLFGKKFISHIIEIERSKKKSLEFFKGDNEKHSSLQKGPLPYQNRPQGGGRYSYTAKPSNQDQNKIFFFEITRVQVLESSTMQVQNQMVNTSFIIQKEVPVTSNSKLVPLIKIADLEHVHQVIRKFFTKSIPNKPLAGRLASFIATWEKITQDQEILSIVKGYKIPFVSLPFQEKITELDKNVKRTIFISGTGSFRNVAERSYPKSSTQTRAISEEPLPCRKKGWREPPNDKFLKSQQIYSLREFQFGRSALSEIPSRTGRFPMQDRSQRAIFFISSQQKLSKVCQISMVR